MVRALRAMGLEVCLRSGDNAGATERVADAVGIADWRGHCTAVDKVSIIASLVQSGHKVLMVGDGLNDGPALAAASVSLAPSSAADLSQMVADVVFQGKSLAPVLRCLQVARRAKTLMYQNLALSIGYNIVMVPLAVAGFITPWLAAAAMSSSSLMVICNSLRLRAGRHA